MTTTPRILVGYDGSDPARHALDWAAQEAVRRGWPLVVTTADDVIPAAMIRGGTVAASSLVVPPARDAERDHLEQVAADLCARHDGLTVETDYVVAGPAAYLVERSAEPGLVVLGTRGLGGVKASVMGGVADEVVTYARGPVCIVPETKPGDGPVVVGVDAQHSSRDAVRHAYDEARSAGCALELLHVVDVDRQLPLLAAMAVSSDAADPEVDAAQRYLDEVLAEVRGWDGDVPVTGRVVVGSPAQALVDASENARFVVVGSRGRGGFTGLLLGSTSRRALRDTRGPAVVVPAR